MRSSCSARAVGLAWDVFGNGKTAVRAGFGTYYSLIDDLAFLLNSLPPYNGRFLVQLALSFDPADRSRRRRPPLLRPGRSDALHHLRAAGSAGRREDSDGRGVEFHGRAATRAATRRCASPTWDRTDTTGCSASIPTRIPAQICPAASGCSGRRRTAGGTAAATEPVRAGRAVHPGRNPARIPIWRGFFWYTEGNSSYNALQFDVFASPEPGPAISRQLHLVEKSGHEFRADRRAGQQPGADDSGPQRSAADWGPSALNVASQASISAQL